MNKLIGKTVLFLHTNKETPRNGEGSFLRLTDGRIMYAYTKFTGTDWCDEAPADIAAIYSYDEGESWSDPEIIISRDEEAGNLMCPSLIRMNNGDVGMLYLKKMKEGINAVPWFVRSEDEGKTFSEPLRCIEDPVNYYVIVNDHAIVLKDGRIILPANFHTMETQAGLDYNEHGLKVVFCSDDDGRSWYESAERQDIPFPNRSETGLQETMIYENEDGKLRALSRTDMAFHYECFSDDKGKTWTTPEPNRFFSAPDSPLLMKRACGMTLSVFNPIPNYTTRDGEKAWGRTPFVCAVSDDDGKSFTRIYFLEDDPENGYCYPAIFDGGEYALIAYYHSDDTEIPLNSLKIKKISKEELKAASAV